MIALRAMTESLKDWLKGRIERLDRRTRAGIAGSGIATLFILTSIVVGATSLWLLPVYWAVIMALTVDPAHWAKIKVPQVRRSVMHQTGETPARTQPIEVESVVAPPASPPAVLEAAPTASKRRRRRTTELTSERTSEALAPPVEVRWMRVGPGKFVRVEGGEADGRADSACDTAERSMITSSQDVEAEAVRRCNAADREALPPPQADPLLAQEVDAIEEPAADSGSAACQEPCLEVPVAESATSLEDGTANLGVQPMVSQEAEDPPALTSGDDLPQAVEPCVRCEGPEAACPGELASDAREAAAFDAETPEPHTSERRQLAAQRANLPSPRQRGRRVDFRRRDRRYGARRGRANRNSFAKRRVRSPRRSARLVRSRAPREPP